jgi:hypothetical protein
VAACHFPLQTAVGDSVNGSQSVGLPSADAAR